MNIDIIYILLLALALDLALGDPPNAIHPVAWMGQVIAFLIGKGKGLSPTGQLIYGISTILLTTALFVTPVYFLLVYLKDLNIIAYIILASLIFKTTFTLRGLRGAALKVKSLLVDDKLAEARFEVRALVGRNTAGLDSRQLISATVESLAENSCDSFFAPLFYFLFLGVPGAVAYRVINTGDAMIGHHGEYEYLGKAAARLDTVVNFIPARLTALTLILACWLARSRAGSAWRTMLRDAGKTESPNAGWTMSAAAGALGVQLEKVGYYKLGDNLNSLSLESIDTTLKIVTLAAGVWAGLIFISEVIWFVAT
jgi:adenosylcobinamide-phosphate synthase